MRPVYHCQPDEFCVSQRETGGEYGIPLEFYCMAMHCAYPGKMCLYVKMGGKRLLHGVRGGI